METLRVDPAILALFSEVVRDAWRERHAADADREKRAAERLRELQRRKDRVVDAYLHEDKLDETTYQQQLARVDREIGEVHRHQRGIAPDGISVESAINFAPRLLTDPPGFWRKLSPERRPALQQAIYPAGITYSYGKFGTAETLLIFSDFKGLDAAVSAMASLDNPTWNRCLDWVQEIERLRDALGPLPERALSGTKAASEADDGDPSHE